MAKGDEVSYSVRSAKVMIRFVTHAPLPYLMYVAEKGQLMASFLLCLLVYPEVRILRLDYGLIHIFPSAFQCASDLENLKI